MKKIIITILLTLTICFQASAAGLFGQTPADYLYNQSPFSFGEYSLSFTGYTPFDSISGFGMARLSGKIRTGTTTFDFNQACQYYIFDSNFISLEINGSKIPGIKLPDQMSFLFVLTFDGKLVQLSGTLENPIVLTPKP